MREQITPPTGTMNSKPSRPIAKEAYASFPKNTWRILNGNCGIRPAQPGISQLI